MSIGTTIRAAELEDDSFLEALTSEDDSPCEVLLGCHRPSCDKESGELLPDRNMSSVYSVVGKPWAYCATVTIVNSVKAIIRRCGAAILVELVDLTLNSWSCMYVRRLSCLILM